MYDQELYKRILGEVLRISKTRVWRSKMLESTVPMPQTLPTLVTFAGTPEGSSSVLVVGSGDNVAWLTLSIQHLKAGLLILLMRCLRKPKIEYRGWIDRNSFNRLGFNNIYELSSRDCNLPCFVIPGRDPGSTIRSISMIQSFASGSRIKSGTTEIDSQNGSNRDGFDSRIICNSKPA